MSNRGVWVRGGAALLSILIDARFGEPPTQLHPVVGMGRYLGLKGRFQQSASPPHRQFMMGAGFVLGGAAACGAAGWGVERGVAHLPWLVKVLGTALLLKPLYSIAALLEAGNSVHDALRTDNLPEARRLLAWHLVSRDTAALSEAEVAGAAVASLAENLTDSIVAPLFYFALFGVPGAAVYRFINTADAVLGYRTPELEYFGKFAARTDDVLNFVPARLAASLLYLALLSSGVPARESWTRMVSDRKHTPSPNGGLTMALTAAGLGVRLEKRGVYVLNKTGRAATASDIRRTNRLIKLSVLFGCSLYALTSSLRGLRRA